MPVGTLSIKLLVHYERPMCLQQVITVIQCPPLEQPSSNPTLQLGNLCFMHQELLIDFLLGASSLLTQL